MWGSDVADIIDDIGIPFTIFGTLTTEKCITKINSQISKPFIREFFLEITALYNTAVVPGNILVFNAPDNRYYLITANAFNKLGNAVITTELVGYKCNSFGKLQRNTGTGWNAKTYKHTNSWVDVLNPCPALLSEVQFGAMSELADEDIGKILTQELKLYLPHSVGIKTNDRYIVDGVNWKIGRIETHRFSGCDVCNVEEDTRS